LLRCSLNGIAGAAISKSCKTNRSGIVDDGFYHEIESVYLKVLEAGQMEPQASLFTH
jgi:hypothetical protein